jgi:AraC family transcriptional regulator
MDERGSMNDSYPFRVERRGPCLPARGLLYGAGEDRRGGIAGGMFEKTYECAVIGVVEDGAFRYHGENGAALAIPGTILFGNAGESFRCEHLDGAGNRRTVIALAAGLLDEAAEDAGLSDGRFGMVAAPPGASSLAMRSAIRRLAQSPETHEELLFDLLGRAFGRGQSTNVQTTRGDACRVLDVARFLAARYRERHTLSDLAAIAGLSRFYFLRQFRAMTGISPHQYLIALRLRAAASRLEGSHAPIIEIALEEGFNDVSHFNRLFRRSFAMAPSQWRRKNKN